MAKINYQIDIDSYIGDGAYSKQYVRNVLEQNNNKPVNVRMNSLGGSLDHGLDISERFANHGDVTVEMFALNASAATVATLGAKTVRMSSSAMYLVHKAMTRVFVMAQVNADNIDDLISDLQDQKENLEKFDLSIAKMYVNKTGKDIEAVMELMKKGGWLNAQEAKDWGFVDEILATKEKVNPNNYKNQIEAFGLPTNCISEKDLFTNIINSQPMKKQPLLINAILNVSELESSEEGVFLNEEQIHSVETRLDEVQNSVTAITGERDAAITAQQTAEQALTAQQAIVTERDATIAAQTTQINNLKKGAGADTKGITTEADSTFENSGNDDLAVAASAKSLYNILP